MEAGQNIQLRACGKAMNLPYWNIKKPSAENGQKSEDIMIHVGQRAKLSFLRKN